MAYDRLVVTSFRGPLDLLFCVLWASVCGFLRMTSFIGWRWCWGIGLVGVVADGHSQTIRLTGPLPLRSRRSFFLAHSFTLSAAWWLFSIPAASNFAGGGCRSMIIWKLCRWTVTLMEAESGSTIVRLSLSLSLASLAPGLSRALQLFISVIFLMVAHRFRAEGPRAPVDSTMKGRNSYLSLSRSQYLALLLVSRNSAVWPGPP